MESLPLRRKNHPTWITCSSLPINAGKHIRPSFSLFSCCACLAQSAHSPRIGFTALSCGSPLSTVRRRRIRVERRLTANSHRINLHLHRSSHSHTEQAKPTMGVHNSHGWLRLGKQGFFIPPWVGPNQHSHSARPLTSPSFLSVAWTMTDYDGTTQ